MLIETPGGFDYTGADCSGWMTEAGSRPRAWSRSSDRTRWSSASNNSREGNRARSQVRGIVMAMKKLILLLALATAACATPEQPRVDPAVAGWRARAEKVTITRDTWGIPHVHGKTDADASSA